MTRLMFIPAFLILNACRSGAPLPPLPEIATTSFLPSIRTAVEKAYADAKASPTDAAMVGRLGMVLHTHQVLAGAAACYRHASLLDPKNFDWKYYLGVVTEGAEAAEALRAALRQRDYLPAKLRLGDVLLALGDSPAARDVYKGLDHPAALFGYGRAVSDPAYYEKALAAFPQYGAAMFALAQQYQRSGRTADAQRLMADYPRFKTTAPPVDDPLMDAVRALNQGPDRLLGEAISLEARGDLAAARDLQLKALELDPKLAQAHINLISLYGRLGDPAAAERHYRDAIALNPNAAEAHYNFGVLSYEGKRRSEARAAFEKVLAIDPNHAQAHNNLGSLLEESGDLNAAAAHFRKAIDTQPAFALARFHLGRIYANQRRYPDALEQLEKAAAGTDDETRATYLYALGATQARSGDTASARATLAKARDSAVARGQSALAASIAGDLERLKR